MAQATVGQTYNALRHALDAARRASDYVSPSNAVSSAHFPLVALLERALPMQDMSLDMLYALEDATWKLMYAMEAYDFPDETVFDHVKVLTNVLGHNHCWPFLPDYKA